MSISISKCKSIIIVFSILFASCNNEKYFVKNKSQISSSGPIDYTDSVITVTAGNYNAGSIKKIFSGEHYRAAWRAPVTVPVIDIRKLGLTPYKKGGNMQSLVLHLQDLKGKKYVLRSIQKNHSKVVPQGLRKTFVVNVAQDQVSSMHPYGAFAIPLLADAAGIFHTNPKPVFIPDDPHLGEYRETFGGMLALFEEKPEGDMSENRNFGNSKGVLTTPQLIEKLRENSNNRVNERNFLKARLLDILIGDWDRSEDQWAWAGFKSGNNNIYYPIPRDRDQVFVKMDGLFPWLYSRKWSVRKIQGFNEDIPDIIGLNMNAKHIDRYLLTELTLTDWKSIADSLKMNLTDRIISDAIAQMPDTIVKLTGKEIIRKLKSRRDKLTFYAEEYYKILSKEVDIIGSNEQERFIVKRSKDSTSVKIYNLNTSHENKPFYNRTFLNSETKEIRLYGLGDNDEFNVTGDVKKGMLIRIIGGPGEDSISDNSFVKGFIKKTRLYDIKEETKILHGKEGKDLSSYDVRVNTYNPNAFNYDSYGPKLVFEYNPDDGLILGGGIGFKHYSFRKSPYSYYQKITAAGSIKTQSTIFRYSGDFIRVLRKWDHNISVDVLPFFTTYFYGFGNETEKNGIKDNYRVQLNRLTVFPAFKRSDQTNLIFKMGPEFQYTEVRNKPGHLINFPDTLINTSSFEPKNFLGPKFELHLQKVDDDLFPTKGIKWSALGSWNFNLNKSGNDYSKIASSVSLFISLPLPLASTIALRAGGSSIFDEFEFFQASTLGGYSYLQGEQNLRGYGRNRFSGRSVAFQNTELRMKLFSFQNLGEVGIIGYYDIGRVWIDRERSNQIHKGYGGGIWLSPLNKIIITATYSLSEEDKLGNIQMGFFF